MKYILVLSLVLIISSATNIFAQSESLVITTYYPSPYGTYDEMRVNRLVIGDVNAASTVTPAQGAVTFSPTVEPIVTASSEGTLYYDSAAHRFRFRDETGNFRDLGGVSFTYHCFTAGNGTPLCVDAGGSQGFCPAGYRQIQALGHFGLCQNTFPGFDADLFYYLPGGNCVYSRWGAGAFHATLGYAYICAQ